MRRFAAAGMVCVLGMSTSAIVMTLMTYRAVAHSDGDAWSALDPLGWAILVSSFGGFAISLALLVHSRYLLATSRPDAEPAGARASSDIGPATPGTVPAGEEAPLVPAARDLSKLPDDERRLYERIEEAGGSVLQMTLVSSGEFSKSKVTRLLDRLESRGLVVRERKGMTNRVKLVR